VSDPTPLEDMTVTDELVERTGNGAQPDDPDDQPTQDPTWVPEGSARGGQ